MERTVTVEPEIGLHARPASKLVQTANRFDVGRLAGRAGERAAVQIRRLDEVVALPAAPAVPNAARAK
ncbi:HPr family phosphocarrier protein [Halorubrum sp. BOL3-1]|nr:HPr family phosphocarrier protein [Halorubrum sp. BOL3-1]QAU11778.1 HPr family phosphocarrier protein [Halorubrum sp. BOL3-1]